MSNDNVEEMSFKTSPFCSHHSKSGFSQEQINDAEINRSKFDGELINYKEEK